jgi:hypothetical protein
MITIHVLHGGLVPCDVVGGLLPNDWPEWHKWTRLEDFMGPPSKLRINNRMQRCQQCVEAVEKYRREVKTK